MDSVLLIVIIVVGLLAITACVVFGVVMYNMLKRLDRLSEVKLQPVEQPTIKNLQTVSPILPLSYDNVNNMIHERVAELWTQKYELYYKLKDIKIISDMEGDIERFVNEVMESFSHEVMINIGMYYTESYLVKMLTRKAQLLMMDYTQKNKPAIK